eukprot:CAMPEP_0172488166 /NCGR_PEP_ID=MMETSP1066-20121228/17564_1 /TAXON_ID=671091 /ORGANISM="Coscinodiscus wailesii, Strain CCMP2513" /LENGTH=546 /DNA_ID=CAMNT_0013255215 /DNA_START=44 /DNA_END=1684 /DNA_ORIENTATION=+
MSSLPPYSTYRTDNKQQMMYPQAVSHGNVLSFTPPGFKQTLNVKFPDCRLAVCEKCKKNYKTRDMCRVRNSHSEEPWSTAYICITLDESCTDKDGKYVDKPFTVRMVQWQPFCVKEPFDHKTPVCAACKKTNRTRSFCRERHQHRQLPWCTVYVILSALDKTDPNTVVAAPSKPATKENEEKDSSEKDEKTKENGSKEGETGSTEEKPPEIPVKEEEPDASKLSDHKDGENLQPPTSSDTTATPATGTKRKRNEETEKGDDINAIDDSRTFLAKVSCKSITIHWLELAEYDGTTATITGVTSESNVQALNAAIRNPSMGGIPGMDPSQYYTAMGYAHHQQQHHQALKMQQQHFLQMQQRQQQHFAAQQAAWQAQYNQQMQMQVTGSAPPSIQQAPSPAPLSSKTQGGNIKQSSSAPTTPMPPSQAAPPPTGAGGQQQQPQSTDSNTAAAIAAQQQAQWQAHMMYQQQLYQQQIQMQQQAGRPGPMVMQHPGMMMQPGMVQPPGVMMQSGMVQSPGQAVMGVASPGVEVKNERDAGGGEPDAKRQCV